MVAVAHGSFSLSTIGMTAFLIFWVLAVKCAAMDLREMDRLLGEAVERALTEAEITITEACDRMKVNEANFRRALKGEGYRLIALNHLVKLGPEFMVYLTAALMWLTAKQRAIEIKESFTVRERA